jgi:hypothetical protein
LPISAADKVEDRVHKLDVPKAFETAAHVSHHGLNFLLGKLAFIEDRLVLVVHQQLACIVEALLDLHYQMNHLPSILAIISEASMSAKSVDLITSPGTCSPFHLAMR